MMTQAKWIGGLAALLMAGTAAAAHAADAPWPPQQDTPPTVGALARANIAKAPKAPVDLTATWMVVAEQANGGLSQFRPLPKLTPAAQALFDAGVKANAAGLTFRDDAGACWPNGMPKFLNRAWPIQILQKPTMIVMIQELENQLRWVYLDGRGHVNPELAPSTWNGESIGRWEGDTLLVDTVNFEAKRHWVETGIPVSDQLHIIERFSLSADGNLLTDDIVMIDPVNWEGEWKTVKHYRRAEDRDIVEVHCPPDLDDHIAGTHTGENGR